MVAGGSPALRIADVNLGERPAMEQAVPLLRDGERLFLNEARI
jgi:hypothetical protein